MRSVRSAHWSAVSNVVRDVSRLGEWGGDLGRAKGSFFVKPSILVARGLGNRDSLLGESRSKDVVPVLMYVSMVHSSLQFSQGDVMS